MQFNYIKMVDAMEYNRLVFQTKLQLFALVEKHPYYFENFQRHLNIVKNGNPDINSSYILNLILNPLHDKLTLNEKYRRIDTALGVEYGTEISARVLTSILVLLK